LSIAELAAQLPAGAAARKTFMNLRFAANLLLMAGLLTATGCRSDPNIALLEAELRWMEDQYYGLENQYNRKCQELHSCRLANQALQQSGARTRQPASQPRSGEPTPAERPPSSRRRNGETPLPPVEPMIEGVPPVGGSSDGSGDLPVNSDLEDEPLPRPLQLHEPLPPGNSRAPGEFRSVAWPDAPATSAPVHDAEVLRIVLNRQLTGGYDRDGVPGDDGILVVIEPQNRAGQFVPVAGPVSLTLTDPRAHDSSELIAAWRLTEEQAAVKLRRSLLGRGLHLELPWPDAPPTTNMLKLTVNFTTVDGRKLLAMRDLTIEPPRSISSRWTPVSPHSARMATRPEPPRPVLNRVDASPAWQPYR
jgi:hypothetical protein